MSDHPDTRSDALVRIMRLAGRAVNRYHMIARGDRIVIGLSGGWDSMILTEVLYRLRKRSPVPFELFPAVVDMEFRNLDVEELKAFMERAGRPLAVLRIDGAALRQRLAREKRPCSLCSRIRRGQLHAWADRIGANVIALGHQLDDVCVSFLLSLFRGGGLKTMGPHVPADGGTKRLIRPLCLVSRRLIGEAARDLDLPRFGECDYIDRVRRHGDREFLENLLSDLDSRFPGVRHAMLRSLSDLRPDHLLDTRYLPSHLPPRDFPPPPPDAHSGS